MAYENILAELADGILIISINRESKMNALNIQTIAELGKAIEQAYTDESVKGVILTGKGVKAFAAGADIAEFSVFLLQQQKKMSLDGHIVLNSIENCPKPVIAAVNGFALGGGCELAMACHFRIASDNAKFGQPEVNLGIIPGYGGTQRLPLLIGKGRAMELIMTGDMLNAEQALRFGLVNHVVKPEELLPKCREILQKIFTKAPLAVSKTIKTIHAALDKSADGFKAEVEAFASCYETADFKEGVTAFLEKRKALFKGE